MKLALLLIVLGVNSIAASTLRDSWRSNAYTLMCNHPGSNSVKATKVRDELRDDYPGRNWVVAITYQADELVYFPFVPVGGATYIPWTNTCGKNMYVWTKPNSEFEKTTCTLTVKRQVANIILWAEMTGGTASAIRNGIRSGLRENRIPYHLIVVVERYDSYVSTDVYGSCFLQHTGDNHKIYVYLA